MFDSADLKEAAKWAAFGVFENMGQSCSAGTRILVQEGVYDTFLEHFKAAAEAFKVGDVHSDETFQGPQVSKLQFDKIMGYIESGKRDARLVTGGARFGEKGYFVQPTVFADVDMGMKIAAEEIFGPVASVIKFKDEEEAIRIANDTTYGLAAAVHSQNYAQVNRVTRRLKAGTVWVNQVSRGEEPALQVLTHSTPFSPTRSRSAGTSSRAGDASSAPQVSNRTSPPRACTTTTAPSSSGPSTCPSCRAVLEGQ